MAKSKQGRRKFLKNAAVTAAAITGPGQGAGAPDSHPTAFARLTAGQRTRRATVASSSPMLKSRRRSGAFCNCVMRVTVRPVSLPP